MIQILQPGEQILSPVELSDTKEFREKLKKARWIDVYNPDPAEVAFIEKVIEVTLPGQEEMHEISESSRLFVEHGTLYMSCWILDTGESEIPRNASVTFALSPDHFVSIRFSDHHAFRIFNSERKGVRLHRFRSTDGALLEVLETEVGHIASMLRLIEQDLNSLSVEIFGEQKQRNPAKKKLGLKQIVQRLGKRNSLVANLRESSLSMAALPDFLLENGKKWIHPDLVLRIQTLAEDIESLRQYDSQLSSEIGFLLDSTVGLIGFEQNQSMKMLSVAALLLAFI
jgi:magnesium transporter